MIGQPGALSSPSLQRRGGASFSLWGPLYLRLMISSLSQSPKRGIWETFHLQVHTFSFFPQSCGPRGWAHHPPLAWDPDLRLYQAWASMGSGGVTDEGLGVIPSSDNSLICWTDFSCKNLFCNNSYLFHRNFSLFLLWQTPNPPWTQPFLQERPMKPCAHSGQRERYLPNVKYSYIDIHRNTIVSFSKWEKLPWGKPVRCM